MTYNDRSLPPLPEEAKAFFALNEIIQNIAKDADDRLSYQNQFA